MERDPCQPPWGLVSSVLCEPPPPTGSVTCPLLAMSCPWHSPTRVTGAAARRRPRHCTMPATCSSGASKKAHSTKRARIRSAPGRKREREAATRVFDAAIAARETLYRLLSSKAEGAKVADRDIEVLNGLLAAAPCRESLAIQNDGGALARRAGRARGGEPARTGALVGWRSARRHPLVARAAVRRTRNAAGSSSMTARAARGVGAR